MAEQLNHGSEKEKNLEVNPFGVHERKPHTHEVKHEQTENQAREKLREISEKVEREAKSSEELETKNETEKPTHTYHQNTQFQAHTGSQAIKRVQKHLKPSDRKFSKVIHNPKVEIASDIAGGTVARPSGLLYGGIFSLMSSLALYIISRHYGYEYSYFVGILFFIGGFVFGLLVESFLKIFKK